MRDVHVMQLNIVEFCENWHCMTILFFSEYKVTWATVWDFESKGHLGKVCYTDCITEDMICSLILQMSELALGFTQPCACWVSLPAMK